MIDELSITLSIKKVEIPTNDKNAQKRGGFFYLDYFKNRGNFPAQELDLVVCCGENTTIMQEWIISAQTEMYDHSSSFEHYGFIDWRQGKIKYAVNDIVFIYSTRPISAIQYKCVVEKVNLDFSEIRDDKEYWKDIEEYERALKGKFFRLRLIDQVSNKKLNLESLKQNGLNGAPQGPVKVVPILSDYLNKYFTDTYQSDFFPELVNEETVAYEGIKKEVIVNKYERSSIARNKCIDFHGLDCEVCEMNFLNTYGDIGMDFIHIHHVIPIHLIGKEYKVDYKNDLIPVCPNCHAMLHRKYNGKEPSIEELREMIKRNKRDGI